MKRLHYLLKSSCLGLLPLLVSCSKDSGNKPVPVHMIYTASLGSSTATPAPALLTYNDANGIAQQQTIYPDSPWRREFDVLPGFEVHISLKGSMNTGGGYAEYAVEGRRSKTELVFYSRHVHATSDSGSFQFSLADTVKDKH